MKNTLSHSLDQQHEQALKKELLGLRKMIHATRDQALALSLAAIQLLILQQKLRLGSHYFWVQPAGTASQTDFDLILRKHAIYKIMAQHSRHLKHPEHIALFESALIHRYEAARSSGNNAFLTARAAKSQKLCSFRGFRVHAVNVDAALATAFLHPLWHNYQAPEYLIDLNKRLLR